MSTEQGNQPSGPNPADATTPQETAMSYTPAPYGPTAYATAPAPVATDPGRTLGIVGLVLSVLTAAIGLVVSIVALRRSRQAGFKNGFALAGIVVGGVVTLAWLVGGIVGGVALGHVASVCQDLGPGTHQVNGVTYTCG